MSLNPVITKEQARQITRGRTPLVPVEYEQAVTALAACASIDDTKYWADKADALAAWAKIYRNDEAGRKAKQLRLHAYRRMGEIARELRPLTRAKNQGAGCLLQQHGLSKGNAEAAIALGKMDRSEFDRIVSQPKPPAPITVTPKYRPEKFSDSYIVLMGTNGTFSNVSRFASFCRNTDASVHARDLTPDEASRVRRCVVEITEWLDQLDQYLPKSR